MEFSVTGYWKDDKSEFSGYIVTDYDCPLEEEGTWKDDRIFFYGLSEAELKELVKLGEQTSEDFVIARYSILKC